MPRIPRFESQIELRQPRVSTEGLAQASAITRKASSSLVETLRGVEQGFIEAIERDQRRTKLVRGMQIEQGFKEDVGNYMETFRNADPNEFYNYEINTDKEFERLKEKYQKSIGNDPDLSLGFEKLFNNEKLATMNVVRKVKDQAMTNLALASMEKDYQSFLGDWASETDQNKRELIRNNWELYLEGMVQNNFLTPKGALDWLEKFDQGSLRTDIARKMNSNDINTVSKLIEDLDKKQFDKITPLEREQYKVEVKKEIERVRKEVEKMEDEKAVMDAYRQLKKDWGSAYPVMYAFLANPEWLKENNLDKKQRKNALEDMLKQEESLKISGDDKAIEAVQNDFITRVYSKDNPLTKEEVDKSILKPVGNGSKDYFNELIRHRVKTIRENTNYLYTTSNGKTLADLVSRSENPNKPPLSATEILSYVGKEDGISIEAAKSLIGASDILKDETFKATESAIKSQFGYEGMLTGFGNKPLGALYYNNWLIETMGELQRKPLKGEELRNKMFELAIPHLSLHWDSTGLSKNEVADRLKVMGRKPSPVTNILPNLPESNKPKTEERAKQGKNVNTEAINKQMATEKRTPGAYQIDGVKGVWDGTTFKPY